jgi:hypothetical protein
VTVGKPVIRPPLHPPNRLALSELIIQTHFRQFRVVVPNRLLQHKRDQYDITQSIVRLIQQQFTIRPAKLATH